MIVNFSKFWWFGSDESYGRWIFDSKGRLKTDFQTAFLVISCAYLPGTTPMRCFSEVFACLNNEA